MQSVVIVLVVVAAAIYSCILSYFFVQIVIWKFIKLVKATSFYYWYAMDCEQVFHCQWMLFCWHLQAYSIKTCNRFASTFTQVNIQRCEKKYCLLHVGRCTCLVTTKLKNILSFLNFVEKIVREKNSNIFVRLMNVNPYLFKWFSQMIELLEFVIGKFQYGHWHDRIWAHQQTNPLHII